MRLDQHHERFLAPLPFGVLQLDSLVQRSEKGFVGDAKNISCVCIRDSAALNLITKKLITITTPALQIRAGRRQ
jgi:hypothetical protein